ncbi:unnamed protein product [Discula destructiva]
MHHFYLSTFVGFMAYLYLAHGTPSKTNIFTLASSMAYSVVAAPSGRDVARGCNDRGQYFTLINGIQTLYTCQGGCKIFDGEPRCDNGVFEPDPFSIEPLGNTPATTIVGVVPAPTSDPA